MCIRDRRFPLHFPLRCRFRCAHLVSSSSPRRWPRSDSLVIQAGCIFRRAGALSTAPTIVRHRKLRGTRIFDRANHQYFAARAHRALSSRYQCDLLDGRGRLVGWGAFRGHLPRKLFDARFSLDSPRSYRDRVHGRHTWRHPILFDFSCSSTRASASRSGFRHGADKKRNTILGRVPYRFARSLPR